MNKKIVFVHFPKSGGVSIRNGLQDSEMADDFIPHYTDDPVDPNSPVNQDLKKSRELAQALASRQRYIIYGHFASRSFSNIDYDHMFTIIRHPIPWLTSLYNYWSKLCAQAKPGHQNFQTFCDSKLSISELLNIKEIREIYTSTYFRDTNYEDFSFVGTHEQYHESVHAIQKILEIRFAIKFDNQGSNLFHWNNLKFNQRLSIRSKLKSEIQLYDYWNARASRAMAKIR
jgi:hypothetical protein